MNAGYAKELAVSLAQSLIMTLALESGFYWLLYKWVIRNKWNKRDALLVILANIVTNPAVVLLYWLPAFYFTRNPLPLMIPLEISAVLAEGYYYKKYGQQFNRPFLFSLAANAVSFGTGFLVQRLF